MSHQYFCFLDKGRLCESSCKAYKYDFDSKSGVCSVIHGLMIITRSLAGEPGRFPKSATPPEVL